MGQNEESENKPYLIYKGSSLQISVGCLINVSVYDKKFTFFPNVTPLKKASLGKSSSIIVKFLKIEDIAEYSMALR